MTPRQMRVRLIRNALTCRQMLRTYSSPVLRGAAAGYFVLIKQELKKLRTSPPKGPQT